jgi:tetratricopeptide (TPR) repeat protein
VTDQPDAAAADTGDPDVFLDRVQAVYDRAEELDEQELVRRIDALAADRPDDALGRFERAGARDYAGLEAEAEPLYRDALELGLPPEQATQARIQLASTLRNLGRPDEALALLDEIDADDELAPAAAAFAALALHDAGRPTEAVRVLARGVAPLLPRYGRAVGFYAEELRPLS